MSRVGALPHRDVGLFAGCEPERDREHGEESDSKCRSKGPVARLPSEPVLDDVADHFSPRATHPVGDRDNAAALKEISAKAQEYLVEAAAETSEELMDK